MLKPRIIPCILLQNEGVVKTVQFTNPKYIGDPINTVRLFNEKEVDELIVLDIDATRKRYEPNYELIQIIATECRMPLCYGGGVKTLKHIEDIVSLGVEKVALSSGFIDSPDLISMAAKRIGSQSVVVVLDAKKVGIIGRYEAFTHNGKLRTKKKIVELAKLAQDLGAGEIVINAIDADGMGQGYDFALIGLIKEVLTIPITVLGGAGCLADIERLLLKFGIIGAAAGSLFVFKGRYRAVLINYPSFEEKQHLLKAF